MDELDPDRRFFYETIVRLTFLYVAPASLYCVLLAIFLLKGLGFGGALVWSGVASVLLHIGGRLLVGPVSEEH